MHWQPFVQTTGDTTISLLSLDDLGDAISDLISDLLHFTYQHGINPEVITGQALSNFAAEQSEEA
jgi:hypothetical protein